MLGYNMFAYCENNPVMCCDSNGYQKQQITDSTKELFVVMVLGAAACMVVANPEVIEPLVDELNKEIAKAKKEIYEYARAAVEKTKRKTPHVHHIVPVGEFSNRSYATWNKIIELHELLKNAGINRYVNPMNLMVVSAEMHASLHTDAYISYVHSCLMATDGSKEQIYAMLFLLRLEIAAMDQYAWGF